MHTHQTGGDVEQLRMPSLSFLHLSLLRSQDIKDSIGSDDDYGSIRRTCGIKPVHKQPYKSKGSATHQPTIPLELRVIMLAKEAPRMYSACM